MIWVDSSWPWQWVTMVGWVDVRDSVRHDFRRRRAVDTFIFVSNASEVDMNKLYIIVQLIKAGDNTKSLWHWGKLKSGPPNKSDHCPWHRLIGKCPRSSIEVTGQILYTAVGSNQVWCTRQRSISFETQTRITEDIPALYQSGRSCNHPTSNWPYQGHQGPYLVPRTAHYLSPLWSNAGQWPYSLGACSVTGGLWRILHSWLIEYSLRDSFRDLHSRIPTISGIVLSDLKDQTFYTILHLNHHDAIIKLQLQRD